MVSEAFQTACRGSPDHNECLHLAEEDRAHWLCLGTKEIQIIIYVLSFVCALYETNLTTLSKHGQPWQPHQCGNPTTFEQYPLICSQCYAFTRCQLFNLWL